MTKFLTRSQSSEITGYLTLEEYDRAESLADKCGLSRRTCRWVEPRDWREAFELERDNVPYYSIAHFLEWAAGESRADQIGPDYSSLWT